MGVIAFGAKMAKADGSVTTDEVKAFKQAFNASAAEMKQAAGIFNLAKQDMTGYEPVRSSSSLPSKATASCSRTYSKVSSTWPKPTRRCIRRKNSS